MNNKETAIKVIETKLTDMFTDWTDAREQGNEKTYDRLTHYGQGIAYALGAFGLSIEWENGTAHVVEM